MNALGNGLQSLRSMIDAVHPRHDRQQNLSSADVRSGTISFDVLFTGLKGHTKRRTTVRIYGSADDSSGQQSLVRFPGGEVSRMRTAISQGNAQTLRRTQNTIGPHFAWRLEQDKGEYIAADCS